LNVTAYTDASFSDRGGWAIWLRSERGRIVRHGSCPETVTDALLAELWAIKEALRIAVESWPETETVLINSDCLAATNALESRNYFKREEAAVLQEDILAFAFAKYLTLRFKHVKGHTGSNDVRSYLNRRCDLMSRRARGA